MAQRTISLGHWLAGDELTSILQLIEQFNKVHPHLEVVPQLVAEKEEEMVEKLLSSSPDASGPDVITLYGESLAKFERQGIIIPLNSFISSAPLDLTDLWENLLEAVTYQGMILGMPLIEANPYALFYNKDLFKQAKIDNPPRNWEELETSARALTKDNDNDNLTDQWGYTQCSFQIPLILWQNEGKILNESKERVAFNEKEGVEALKFLTNLRRKYSPPHVNFERGDVGMKLSIVQNIKKYQGMNFSLVPLPAGKVRANSFGGSKSVNTLAILNKSKERQEIAWEFIRWWDNPENYTKWCKLSGYVPIKKSTLKREDYQEYLKENPLLKIFIGELEYARARPCIPAYKEIKMTLNKALGAIEAEEDLSEERIRECLDQSAQEAQELLSKGNL